MACSTLFYLVSACFALFWLVEEIGAEAEFGEFDLEFFGFEIKAFAAGFFSALGGDEGGEVEEVFGFFAEEVADGAGLVLLEDFVELEGDGEVVDVAHFGAGFGREAGEEGDDGFAAGTVLGGLFAFAQPVLVAAFSPGDDVLGFDAALAALFEEGDDFGIGKAFEEGSVDEVAEFWGQASNFAVATAEDAFGFGGF